MLTFYEEGKRSQMCTSFSHLQLCVLLGKFTTFASLPNIKQTRNLFFAQT